MSRVVNGNYFVSAEIRERVVEAIDTLQYQPNYFARSLKGASTLTIAIVVSDISNSYYSLVAKAIEDVVWPHDYDLIFASTERHAERERATLGNLVNKKIDGLILNTTGHNDKYVEQISRLLPVVLLHRRPRRFKGDFVDSDNRRGAAELAEHLQAAGHRAIGVINGMLDLSSGAERFAGYCDAMAAIGPRPDHTHLDVYNGDFAAESGYRGMEYLHRERPDVTAVVIMNNAMTIGALRYLHDHRVRVPADYSIVCYGDIENQDLLYVRPTVVSLDPATIGRRTAEMLISRIEQPGARNRQYIYQPVLRSGESVGPPRTAGSPRRRAARVATLPRA